MGKKLDRLLDQHRILLVHPVIAEKYLLRPGGKIRKSPRHGSIFDLFGELVSVPTLLDHPNLTLEVVLVSVTDVQAPDPKAWRGALRSKWRSACAPSGSSPSSAAREPG